MKTYVPTKENLEKKWYLVDAKGKTLGRIATKIVDLLRGKKKPFFTPQQDCGDYVVIINARHIRLSGKKLEKKLYFWHTRYPSGLRQRTAKEVLEKKPEQLIFDAVSGMLPRNKLKKRFLKHLRIFSEEKHSHEAQQLIPLEL